MLPTELGYGSGSTCWRRFRAWTQSGVRPELHRRLLRVLGRRGRINLERAVIDSASMRALKGAHTGPNPTDRGKNGCKRHIVTDAEGIPLVVRTGPANRPDAELALEMLDAIPPCGGQKGRPRRRPKNAKMRRSIALPRKTSQADNRVRPRLVRARYYGVEPGSARTRDRSLPRPIGCKDRGGSWWSGQ